MAETFNACAALIDHHIAAGRGGKVAFTDADRT